MACPLCPATPVLDVLHQHTITSARVFAGHRAAAWSIYGRAVRAEGTSGLIGVEPCDTIKPLVTSTTPNCTRFHGWVCRLKIDRYEIGWEWLRKRRRSRRATT